jgi:hypothetical protein
MKRSLFRSLSPTLADQFSFCNTAVPATIATYQFNFRVLHHPSSRGFCGPISQYVEHLMRLYVHDDPAEFASPSDPKSRQYQSVAPIQLVLSQLLSSQKYLRIWMSKQIDCPAHGRSAT